MKRRILITGLTAAVGLLACASPAAATTFCVPGFHAACPNDGTNVAQPSLGTAMQTDDSDGVADTILLAPGTITSPGSVQTTGSDALLIKGAGPDATTITTSSTMNVIVVDLGGPNTRAVTLQDLEIAVPASAPDNSGAALQVEGDTLQNVDIVSRNPGSSGSQGIISWVGGGTYMGGAIGPEAGGTLDTAIGTGGASSAGPVLIEDVTIRDARNAINGTSPGAAITVRRTSLVNPKQIAYGVVAGTMTVQNSTVVGTGVTPLEAAANSASSSVLIADHVTALNAGPTNVAAVASNNFAFASGSSKATVSNSIFRGFGDGYQRQGGGPGQGHSDLTVRYSNLPPSGTSTGLGTLNTNQGNITADPSFTGPSDFRLLLGSPSIDAGDPASGGLDSDFLGTPRPSDGNSDGVAVRDQGAYEYQPVPPPPTPAPDTTAPETKIDKGPGKKKSLTRGKASFRFSSSEVGSSFECKLDRKKFKPCQSPAKLKRLKRGKHLFLVRAIDAAGNVDASPASARFKVKRQKKRRQRR